MDHKPDCDECTMRGLTCQWPPAGWARVCRSCAALKLKCEIAGVAQSNKRPHKDTGEGAGPSKKPKAHPLFTSDSDSGASPTPLAQPPLSPLQWGEPIVPPIPSEGSTAELVGVLNDLRMWLVLLNAMLVEQAERDLRWMVAWDRMMEVMELLHGQMASTQVVWAGLMLVRHQRVTEGEEV